MVERWILSPVAGVRLSCGVLYRLGHGDHSGSNPEGEGSIPSAGASGRKCHSADKGGWFPLQIGCRVANHYAESGQVVLSPVFQLAGNSAVNRVI